MTLTLGNLFKIILLIIALCFGVLGQSKENFCDKLKGQVMSAQDNEFSDNKLALLADCTAVVRSNDHRYYINLNVYASISEANENLAVHFDFIASDETYPEAKRPLGKHRIWDNGMGFDKKGSSLLMLLRGKCLVTLIGPNYNRLLKYARIAERFEWSLACQ